MVKNQDSIRISTGASSRVALGALLAWFGLCSVGASRALAQPDNQPQPWHQGVSAAAKEQARALHREAVALHEQLRISEAIERYERALSLWDHPEIHFHLSKALANQDKSFEADEHLRAARRFAERGLSPAQRTEAETLSRELAHRLVQLEVVCDEPEAVITVNERQWRVGAGTESRVVRPGFYVITARKPGYHPVSRSVSLFAGQRARVVLHLSKDEGTRYDYRFRRWQPWTLAGAGAALALAGGALQVQAGRAITDFETAWFERCTGRPDNGCYEGQQTDLIADLDGARTSSRVAIGMLVVGIGAALTGLTLAALNTARVHPDKTRGRTELAIEPLVAASGEAGILARWSF